LRGPRGEEGEPGQRGFQVRERERKIEIKRKREGWGWGGETAGKRQCQRRPTTVSKETYYSVKRGGESAGKRLCPKTTNF
jgi:hypothetical protein